MILETLTHGYGLWDIEHCYNLMTHFQGLGVLSVSARKPVLTCTAFL